MPAPSAKLASRRRHTLETFEADDPWNSGMRAIWALDLHELVPRRARPGRRGRPVHALRSSLDEQERFLPEALAELWHRQRVPSATLPRLLAAIEPDLRPGDFLPVLPVRLHRWVAAALALAALVLAILTVRVATATGGHRMSRLSLSDWLARPQREDEDLVTDRPVSVAGTLPVAFEPQLPPHLFAYPADGRFVLAWYPAARGHRLLLAPEDQLDALPKVALAGVTLAPASIGLPEAPLRELRARVPDLETTLVTALFWTWTDITTPRRRVVLAHAGATALAAGSAVLAYLVVGVRQWRRRRQMAWLLAKA